MGKLGRLFVVVAMVAVAVVVEGGVAQSIGVDAGGGAAVWSPRSVGETVERDLEEFGLGDGVGFVTPVDPKSSELKAMAESLSVGDAIAVELADGQRALITVGRVLIEREVSDGPAPIEPATEGWKPRFVDGDVTIVGSGTSADGIFRSFRVTTFGDLVSAELWSAERVQTLRPDVDGNHVMIDAPTPVAINADGPDSGSALEREAVTAELFAAFAGASAPDRFVDILVVTSDDAETAAPSDTTIVARDILAKLNEISSNNNIDVEFRLVGFYDIDQALPDNGPPTNQVVAADLLEQLIVTTDLFLNDVPVARDAVNADLVIQLTGDIYDESTPPMVIGGSVEQVRNPGDADAKEKAFAVFNVSQPVTTAAHEVGHLYGALHDTFVEPANLPFAYGHGYVYAGNFGESYVTTMARTDDPLCDTGCIRSPYWSDPSATPHGAAGGAGTTADVARVVDEQTPVISAYEPTTAQRLFRPSTGQWFIDADDDGNWDGCSVDMCRGPYGALQRPVLHPSGQLGYLNPTTGIWSFDSNSNDVDDGCAVDTCFGPFAPFGGGVDTPFVLSDGTIGTFFNGSWRFDDSGDGVWQSCVVDGCGTFGQVFDRPVLDADSNIGVYRHSTGQWFFDGNGDRVWSGCGVDTCLGPFGAAGDRPTVTVDGQIGLFRPATGQWFFDLTGDGLWNGCAVDLCRGAMGASTDLAVDSVGSFAP